MKKEGYGTYRAIPYIEEDVSGAKNVKQFRNFYAIHTQWVATKLRRKILTQTTNFARYQPSKSPVRKPAKAVLAQKPARVVSSEEARKLIRDGCISVFCGIYRNEETYGVFRHALGVTELIIGTYTKFKEGEWQKAILITVEQGKQQGPLITRLRFLLFEEPTKTIREQALAAVK